MKFANNFHSITNLQSQNTSSSFCLYFLKTLLVPVIRIEILNLFTLFKIFEGNCISKQKHCWNIKSIMAYGGTPSGPPAASGSSPAMKQVKLEKESELRIEVSFNSSLRLRLLNGTAEIFGTEMPPENWLIFPPRMKFAVNS